MNLKKTTQNLIAKHKIRPNLINYGQHFLIDPASIELFIESLSLKPNNTVLEIGPGLGYLTEEIAKQAKQVTAVEIDQNLKPILARLSKRYSNINLIYKNILNYKKYDFDVVCGALAFNIFEPLLRQLIYQFKFRHAIFIVSQRYQEEFLNMNNLTALMADAFFQVDLIKTLSIQMFYPEPQYPGLIVRLIPQQKNDKYHFLLREIFLQKNRRLKKALRLALEKWYNSQGIRADEDKIRNGIKFITQAPEASESIFQVNKHYLQSLVGLLKQI